MASDNLWNLMMVLGVWLLGLALLIMMRGEVRLGGRAYRSFRMLRKAEHPGEFWAFLVMHITGGGFFLISAVNLDCLRAALSQRAVIVLSGIFFAVALLSGVCLLLECFAGALQYCFGRKRRFVEQPPLAGIETLPYVVALSAVGIYLCHYVWTGGNWLALP